MNNSSAPLPDSTETARSLGIQHIILMICGIWTIGANALILCCFYKNRRRPWTGFSRQVCSMTLGDFLSGCTSTHYMFMHLYRVNNAFCSISFYLFLSTQCVSIFHVLGICIFRNLKMKNITLHESQSQSFRISMCIIVSAWALSFLVMLMPFVFWADFKGSIVECSGPAIFGNRHNDVMFYIASFYGLSQVLTNAIYVVAVCRLRAKIRQILPRPVTEMTPQRPTTSLQPSDNKSKPTNSTVLKAESPDHSNLPNKSVTMKQNTSSTTANMTNINNVTSVTSQPALSILKNYRSILITTGFVLLVFDVFTLPFTITFFAATNTPYSSIRAIGVILLSVNSAINPIVYATRITSIRRAVTKLFQDWVNLCCI